MKKFLLSSVFAATFALLSACGDDSSSGPAEESSSSIEAEEESSSGEGTPESSAMSSSAEIEEPESSSSNVIASSSSAKQSSSSSEVSSSSEEESSSSEGESSSSVVFPDGVKPSGYYKDNCPAGHTCKDAAPSTYLKAGITYGEILDTRDDQVYKVVTIGDQTWMAQNLNYAPDEDYVAGLGEYAWSGCYGEGNESYTEEQVAANCSKYGRLYSWEVAMDKAGCGYENDCNNSYEGTQGVCPNGWHLPSKDEFETLLGSVGSSDKERSANLTALSWGNGQDKFGFSALPAGNYNSDSKEFYNLGYGAHFWSSTEYAEDYAYNLDIDHYNADVYGSYENFGGSVRCLKDN
ncbi:MAG: hypothetical protein MJY47_01310 [Fibrobacter sp.]|nr:hypothetical protein [Fibrobacter sp.]